MKKIIESRKKIVEGLHIPTESVEGEGGCGVVGFACTTQVEGRHLLAALRQMTNRGNGKGGGIAAVGLDPSFFNTSLETLESHYLLAIAFLDLNVKEELENEFIASKFDIASQGVFPELDDFSSIGLEIKPPTVHYYLVKPKTSALDIFVSDNDLSKLPKSDIEDEFVYQNSFLLNKRYYSSLGEKKAFVLSHGKNLLVLKIVGYANQVIEYYKMENFKAHVWIGHHRYPTKGTVWHPGGAHPFIGLNEALVHNGDFANYHSVAEYLAQRNIYPLFLTDTEVAALQFDLYSRVYKYPIEAVIEALAPTTERDFVLLPPDKKELYSKIQYNHLHGSPDGPWFFIIAQNVPAYDSYNLIGITDTSMLRPQVFAIQSNEETIGLIASERQAIDAILRSMSEHDPRFGSKADIYWNARGGSHTDGGAFIFSIDKKDKSMVCTNKFGQIVHVPEKRNGSHQIEVIKKLAEGNRFPLVDDCLQKADGLPQLIDQILTHHDPLETFHSLSFLLDIWHLIPNSSNGMLRGKVESGITNALKKVPHITDGSGEYLRINFETWKNIRSPMRNEKSLVIDIADFPPEGEESAAFAIVEAYRLGWKHVITFDWRGQRFCGSGLGPNSDGFRIDVYGNPGDYLGSGLDGAEIYVHTAAQDQVGQIMRRGKLVVYGDVGQTFMYGAKGGEAFVLGNAAGRPLINAGGSPRVVINGTCLDYLAESFMAGDPLNGGGFVIINGVKFDENGAPVDLPEPYPGGNLFSLASGGGIYIRDPNRLVSKDQLNGGTFVNLSPRDMDLILHYLDENASLFRYYPFSKEMLNQLMEQDLSFNLYRKIIPVKLKELS